ncbi:MAG: MATE family efflux transporter, partial [Oscillospiraceae bacterium]|nr:MATE family efflux transporter [Oscillospiraceae bacterium]
IMREHGKIYMLGNAGSYPFFALTQTVLGAMRGSSDTKSAVLYSAALNLLGLVGNVIFLVVFKFGIFGLSLAIILSRLVIAAPALFYLIRRGEGLRADAFFRPRMGLQRSIMYVAAPTGLEQVFFHTGRLLTQVFIVGYGTMSAAANAIVLPLSFFVQISGMTIMTALVTIVGHCMGAGDVKSAKRYIKVMTLTCIAATALSSLIFAPILPWFLSIYNLPPEAYELALSASILILIGTPLTWPGSFVIPSGLRAAGDARFNMAASILCMWAVRVGMGYYLGTVLGYGLNGIWVAMFIEWTIRTIIFTLRVRGDKWALHKVI